MLSKTYRAYLNLFFNSNRTNQADDVKQIEQHDDGVKMLQHTTSPSTPPRSNKATTHERFRTGRRCRNLLAGQPCCNVSSRCHSSILDLNAVPSLPWRQTHSCNSLAAHQVVSQGGGSRFRILQSRRRSRSTKASQVVPDPIFSSIPAYMAPRTFIPIPAWQWVSQISWPGKPRWVCTPSIIDAPELSLVSPYL
jgi:hypothetical protein